MRGNVTITKRTDGRPKPWLVRWVEDDGTQRKRAFTRKVEAEQFSRELVVQSAQHRYVTPGSGRQTVGEFGGDWVLRQVHLTPKSDESQRSLWRAQVEPRWGEVSLDAVRHGDVARWVSDQVKRGLSASTVRKAYNLLTAILDAAVRERLLGHNDARGVDLPRLKNGRDRYLSVAELHAFADAAGAYRPFVLVLGLTGLRWGEATALRVRDFDPARGRLRVEEAVTEVHGAITVGEAKGHRKRPVPVPAFLVEILTLHVKGRRPDDLMFTAARGGYMRNPNTRRDWWNAAAVKAEVPGLVPHELRHTAASLAIAAGADVKMVQRMLGHVSAVMTLDRYGHLWEDGLDGVADRLDAMARPPQWAPVVGLAR